MPKFTVIFEKRLYTVIEAESEEQAKGIAAEDLKCHKLHRQNCWCAMASILHVTKPDPGLIKDFEQQTKEWHKNRYRDGRNTLENKEVSGSKFQEIRNYSDKYRKWRGKKNGLYMMVVLDMEEGTYAWSVFKDLVAIAESVRPCQTFEEAANEAINVAKAYKHAI